MEHKQVIVLRKDLNMRKGKMVAQGAHAAMRAVLKDAHREGNFLMIPLDSRNEPWLCGRFKKICASVNSESGLITALIQDAGLTEFGGVPTYTGIAIGPDEADKVDVFTRHLPLL
jgi:PTH2 family peptidyl-tRNA hydrolase